MDSSKLRKINNVDEAPSEAYLFYNLKGGIYCLPREHYSTFATHWCNVTSGIAHNTMDLAAANSHSLILDIDATLLDDAPRDIPESLFDLIHSNLNLLFLPAVPHFTYIVATRPHSCGVHVYLPEFCISHDDYIQFC
ncbi:hypothetical protein AVEN_161221-1 [Araneus ventricosus]|uniref:Uncharacterized protein n=1 Tax=Araneus ventricosus TaxID=182803 RepID=A0A4Y1ZTQ3_ARAVE|nr:hypothetical protein AVEN_161221-1 [Araneus ventricosus]